MIPSYFKIEILAICDKFVTQEHKGLTAFLYHNILRSVKIFILK